MIEQQINLYHERFHEKRLWISAGQTAAAVLLLIAAGAIWSYLLHDGLEEARQQQRQLQAERDRLTADLTVINAELSRLLQDTSLDEEINTVGRQISAREKVLNFVDDNRFGSGEGFSNYLVALSNLHVDDIWLSRIRFGDDFFHIEGSSLDAEIVPTYFDRFSEEAVFRGNRFDLFRLSRPTDSDWKVDFVIATSETTDE